MIFYLCNGQELVGTQAEAKAIDKNFVQVDVPTDKAGLMAYLNPLLADQHDAKAYRLALSKAQELGFSNVLDALNVPEREDPTPPPTPEPQNLPVREQSYTAVTISLEDQWEDLPLPLKLHFASRALEEARSRIKVIA